MTISKDLFLAILSMDAYNRGYDSGISDGSNLEGNVDLGLGDQIGRRIGQAQIVQRVNSDPNGEAQDAGFYAVAYDVGGKTVISIRGTDNNSTLDFWDNDTGGSDAWNGYGVATGSPTGAQARLAAKFYQSVVAQKLGVSNPDNLTEAQLKDADITLTGHSMGGRLAV